MRRSGVKGGMVWRWQQKVNVARKVNVQRQLVAKKLS